MISDSKAAMCYQATLYRVLKLLITTNCKSDINHDYVAGLVGLRAALLALADTLEQYGW